MQQVCQEVQVKYVLEQIAQFLERVGVELLQLRERLRNLRNFGVGQPTNGNVTDMREFSVRVSRDRWRSPEHRCPFGTLAKVVFADRGDDIPWRSGKSDEVAHN